LKILENKNNMLILDNDKNIDFISYKTHIARYCKDKNILILDSYNWNISQTTIKQLKEFINYYTSFNYTTKKEFELEIEKNKKIKLVDILK